MDQAVHTEANDVRAAPRRRVRVRALIREAGSSRIDIDMVDLSSGGFRFFSVYRFAVGARVFLTVAGLAPQEAVIAWHAGDDYGCRFVRPLYPAVFEALVARLQ